MLVIPGPGQGVASEVSGLLSQLVESLLQVVELLPFSPCLLVVGILLVLLNGFQGVDEQGILATPPVF
jgi:hypothetical protein